MNKNYEEKLGASLRSITEEMSGKFDEYWSEYNVYLSCATILDPIFKVKFVEYCLVNLFGMITV